MSWFVFVPINANDFAGQDSKKAFNRTGTSIMIKVGQVEKTIDRDFEIEERRYRTLESADTRLQKEAKGYLDSLRGNPSS